MMCGLKSPVLNGIEDRNCILKKKLKKLMVLQYVLTKVQELIRISSIDAIQF